MDIPEGHNQSGDNHKVCLLKRPLYGLKQSPKQWNMRIVEFFQSIKFTPLKSDNCIFVKKNIWIAVYVDDIVIFTEDKNQSDIIVKLIEHEFDIKDLGEPKLLLGLNIEKIEGGLFIHQNEYAYDIVKQLQMLECKPVSTPISPGEKFTKSQCPTSDEGINAMKHVPYRETIGKLLFLSKSTRPDILNATISLSRFNSNPGPAHWRS